MLIDTTKERALYIETDRLRDKRVTLGITQMDIARHCGISERQVQRYEARQSKPSVGHLLCIAGLLKVSFLWLLGISDTELQFDLRPDQLEVLQAYEAGDVQTFARLLRKKRAK